VTTSLTEALLLALARAGATEIFGIPGDFVIPVFKEIERTGVLPLYTLSHEPAVGFAADAAARMGGGMGVAAVTYGPGALNVVNAVANAFAERSPLVVISGAPSSAEMHSGFLVHHQVKSFDSQRRIYREVTCDQVRLDDLATAPDLIARALRSAREQSRPVYIEIPRDLAARPCADVPVLVERTSDPQAVEECAAEILERIGVAAAPVLLVGVEARRYRLSHKVAELARRLGLPIVTTFMGRGLFAGVDAPVVGTYLGLAGDARISRMVERSDALLMLGPVFSDTNFGVSAHKLDVRHAMLASLRQVRIGHHVYPTSPRMSEAPLRAPEDCPRGLVADAAPIDVESIVCAVNDWMARHGPLPITADVGDCLFAAMSVEHTALIASACYATMGMAIPAALGVQTVGKQRPIVMLGDGAFQMTGTELGNCSRYGWDPIVLVFDNRSWGMLHAFDPDTGFNRLSAWDYPVVARALGGEGVRATTRVELRDALERAQATRGRFFLIDVELDAASRSPVLQRFVDALQAGRDAGSRSPER
jgi:indolepyruvate decarboxylase